MSAKVSVSASARLHLGFLDMNGGLGRKFGGLGLALDAPVTRLTLTRAETNQVDGPESVRAERLLETTQAVLTPTARHRLTLHEAIPAHSGFGSGTQLALAVAVAVRRLEGLPDNPAADAAMLSRGARSGLGAGLFAQGGLVVDGGRGPDTLTPPVIARAECPEDWRVLLVSDPAARGLHGAGEKEAFATLPPLDSAASGELCRRVLMQALPALAERNLQAFGDAVTRIQEIVGDYFASEQGGHRYTSANVEGLMARLRSAGATGIGQTSWGPTGFAFVDSESTAKRIIARVEPEARALGLSLSAHKGCNYGAKIDSVYARIA